MKSIFYTYWLWFIFLIAINHCGLVLPMWTVGVYKILLMLNFAYLSSMPILKVIETDRVTKNDVVYLEAIVVSILARSVLYCASFYGYGDRWELLSVIGIVMMIYYIFDVRQKLKTIE